MLEIVKVLMDYEKDPVGVEEMPQFSWKLKSDKRNVVQSAYRLQIAENRDFKRLSMTAEGSKAVNLPTSARQGQKGTLPQFSNQQSGITSGSAYGRRKRKAAGAAANL